MRTTRRRRSCARESKPVLSAQCSGNYAPVLVPHALSLCPVHCALSTVPLGTEHRPLLPLGARDDRVEELVDIEGLPDQAPDAGGVEVLEDALGGAGHHDDAAE